MLQSLEGNARQSQRKQNHVFVNLRWKDLEKSRNHIILPFCDNAVSFFVSDASVSIVSWTSCLSTWSWWSTGWGFILVHHVTPFNLQSKGKTYVYIYIMWEFQNKKTKHASNLLHDNHARITDYNILKSPVLYISCVYFLDDMFIEFSNWYIIYIQTRHIKRTGENFFNY